MQTELETKYNQLVGQTETKGEVVAEEQEVELDKIKVDE